MKAPSTIRLAGEDLGDDRHVCILADGPEATFDFLGEFIAEGIAFGQRAVHIVDPTLRDAHEGRLRARGIDVDGAMASRQLEIHTWNESYMHGGRFDRAFQLRFLRQSLEDGMALGFPLTRYIGSVDWAVGPDTVRDLLAYETQVNDLLRRVPDVLMCTYDVNHHSARTIADVLSIHPTALVGGEVRRTGGGGPASARDRILAAASRQFHETGIQATGVDSLIKGAGVAKATFYRHFASKDDLVVAWLRSAQSCWFERVQASAQATGAAPEDELMLFFEGVADWLEAEGFRGCPYLNTAAEITDGGHPARLIVREILDEIATYLRNVLEAGRYTDAEMLTREVHALLAGSITLGASLQTSAYVLAARDAAGQLLANAERRPSIP